MPDITICTNTTCPLRASCYRSTAKPNELWQSVAKFEYFIENGVVKCLMFWKDEKRPTSI